MTTTYRDALANELFNTDAGIDAVFAVHRRSSVALPALTDADLAAIDASNEAALYASWKSMSKAQRAVAGSLHAYDA